MFYVDQQVEFLARRKHIYLLPNGSMNVSAINSRNLDYVTESIHQALTSQLWPCVEILHNPFHIQLTFYLLQCANVLSLNIQL